MWLWVGAGVLTVVLTIGIIWYAASKKKEKPSQHGNKVNHTGGCKNKVPKPSQIAETDSWTPTIKSNSLLVLLGVAGVVAVTIILAYAFKSVKTMLPQGLGGGSPSPPPGAMHQNATVMAWVIKLGMIGAMGYGAWQFCPELSTGLVEGFFSAPNEQPDAPSQPKPHRPPQPKITLPPISPKPPVKLALIVTLDYLGTSSKLPSTKFDSGRMYGILKTTYGFQSIRVMHDDLKRGHPMYPTVQNVKAQIIAIVAEARRLHNLGRRCSLFIYYSGHGGTGWSSAESTNDKECLVLRDGKLWDTELNEILADQIPYLTTAFVMADACHSGTLLDLRYRYDSDVRVWNERSRPSAERRGRPGFAKVHTPNDPTRKSPGRLYYLSGCGDGEKSVELGYRTWLGEIKPISGGALTLAFEELLKNPRRQNFTIEEMVMWIIGNVQNSKGCMNQTPLLSRNFRSNRSTSFADAINGRDHTPPGGDNRNPHGVRVRLNERPPHAAHVVMGVPVKLYRGKGSRNQGS